ncbi:hypothetical protein Snoj_82890 [Streptomyces nojiriensis]|uniref:Uncharacterized protein n=1 Tax=Streptomyces nojiriensis TaxID=66374 RepID=A0ABQ3T1V5_9ACTN|nr:hypothetical protein GCM10010205_51370 [Streptomyces nojiriensis]GHI74371.1 hypothetical protein Snoj_82890 [Streptomyces nojiriensis]
MGAGRTVWAVAGLCGLTAVGLLLVAVLLDLDTGDRVASVAGAVAGLLGCALTVYFGMQQGGRVNLSVQAKGRSAVAGGRDVSGNAVGKNSKVTRAANSSASRQVSNARSDAPVSARGHGATAAGGHVTGNAIGEGSEVEES